MIVISAATGELGRLVVDNLLQRVPADDVAVAVRNPAKAAHLAATGVAVRYADYTEPVSLRSAFAGADRLLFISSSDVESGTRVQQHRNVVDAAGAAGVGAIAYTSGLGADVVDESVPVLGDHHVTERFIRDSGLALTILRNPIYSDFFINPQLQAAIETGEVTSSTQGRGMNTATRADLAEAAAAAILDPQSIGRAYNFTGRLWSFPELAEVLSEVSGRPVTYQEVDSDEGIVAFLGLGPVIRAGGFESQTPDLEQILGRPPTSLADAVAAAVRPTAADS